VQFIIATSAAIGTGETFKEPHVEGARSLFYCYLGTRLIPAAPEIALPAGAPGPLCLYADYRPRQLETLVYLCNAGPDPLAEVTLVTDTIDGNEFSTLKPDKRWAEARDPQVQQVNTVPPGTCVLVNALCHQFSESVNRHRLTFSDAAGRRWTTWAHDHPLNAWWLAEDPDEVWVTFRPACPADQTGAEEQPKEAP
jgi:hypothetical protein